MANLRETPTWEEGIYQWETSDPVMGGENGIDNKPTRQLANRTSWLKTELARAVALIGTNQQTATQQFALKTTSLTAGAGLSGGGVLRDNMTLSLGTPSKITATSQNSAISNTHTHEIDKASTSVAGIVRLNNTLTSTSQTEALTAAQGKVLAEQAMAAASNADNRVAKTGDTMTGSLNIRMSSGYSGVYLFSNNGGETRLEAVPENQRNDKIFQLADRQGTGAFTVYQFPKATEHQNVAYHSWVNSNFVGRNGNQSISGELNVGGVVVAQYRNDWVGFYAKQPTEGKHGFFELVVNNTLRGGIHVFGENNGKYGVRLLVTPDGATNQDRRVVGLNVLHDAIHANAYGWFHEGFVRAGNGIGQEGGHQIKIGWGGANFQLKATVDNTDLGNIVFERHFHENVQKAKSGYQKLPNGLIFQWVEVRRNVGSFFGEFSFPIAFPNQCFGVCMGNHANDATAGNGYFIRAKVISNSRFHIAEDYWNTNSRGQMSTAFVIAIGH